MDNLVLVFQVPCNVTNFGPSSGSWLKRTEEEEEMIMIANEPAERRREAGEAAAL